jgi:dynein heavy chain
MLRVMSGEAQRLCRDFCNESGMFQRLEKSQSQLTMCEKALNDFMDGKRRAFPRFYFVSTSDLLDILSNGNTPAKVMRHLSKVFQVTFGVLLNVTVSVTFI